MSYLAKHLLAATAALAAAASAGGAAAMPTQDRDAVVYGQLFDQGNVRRVSYADLNLADVSGQKRLNDRVRRAVSYVCSDLDRRGWEPKYFDCKDFAWSGARPQMASAIARAQQIASTGSSSIAPVAIAVRGVGQ